MNTWELIKQDITQGAAPGSTAYLLRVKLGATVYCAIRPHLKPRHIHAADPAFNADTEVGKAFAVAGQLEGVLTSLSDGQAQAEACWQARLADTAQDRNGSLVWHVFEA